MGLHPWADSGAFMGSLDPPRSVPWLLSPPSARESQGNQSSQGRGCVGLDGEVCPEHPVQQLQ